MFPNQKMHQSLKKQRGSMLVIALFVIIVLAFLAYAMIEITENSNRAAVYEVYGARALHAANSGVERSLNEVLGPNVTESCDNLNPGTPTPARVTVVYSFSDSINSVAGASFSGCEITVNCDQFNVSSTGYTHFRIKSTASCTAGAFDTHRSVSVEARVIK